MDALDVKLIAALFETLDRMCKNSEIYMMHKEYNNLYGLGFYKWIDLGRKLGHDKDLFICDDVFEKTGPGVYSDFGNDYQYLPDINWHKKKGRGVVINENAIASDIKNGHLAAEENSAMIIIDILAADMRQIIKRINPKLNLDNAKVRDARIAKMDIATANILTIASQPKFDNIEELEEHLHTIVRIVLLKNSGKIMNIQLFIICYIIAHNCIYGSQFTYDDTWQIVKEISDNYPKFVVERLQLLQEKKTRANAESINIEQASREPVSMCHKFCAFFTLLGSGGQV